MRSSSLSFCDIEYHNDIVEIIAHEGIEVNEAMAKEFLSFINNLEPKATKILVNRINKYSYSFKANLLFARSKVSADIAIVKYGKLPWPISGVFTPKFYHLAFFDQRLEAIDWLNSKTH